MFSKHLLTRLFQDQIGYLSDHDRFLFAAEGKEPQYRFNIIGAGMIGSEHIRVTLLEGRAVIHGIFDINRQSAAAAAALANKLQPTRSVQVYDTLAAACADSAADAFIICTPNHTHLTVLRTVAATKKPILLEKPMATTIAAAVEIFELAQSYESMIQVGLQYRYKAIYRECRAEVGRAALGTLKTITIMEHRLPFLDKVEQWNKFSRYSGGTLVEKCCHYFDLFNLFAQSRPVAVTSAGGGGVNFPDFAYNQQPADIIDHAAVIVTYQNGMIANFHLCMFAPMFHEQITLCGTAGRIQASESEDFLSGGLQTSFTMHCTNGRPARSGAIHYPEVIEQSGHSGATFFEHVNFIENIAGNPTETATVAEGLWSVIIGVAAEQSLKEGRTILIDELLQGYRL